MARPQCPLNGTIKNYLNCYDLGVKSHFESFEKAHRGSGRQKGIFAKEEFIYNRNEDTFSCPAGQKLKRRRFSRQRQQYEYYMPKKICGSCRLREQCTRSSMGRSLKRHLRQDELDCMLKQAQSPAAKRDIKTRQHLMERSFARATRYGLHQARWRRLWRVQIQEYLTATIQNLMVLLSNIKEPSAALGRRVNRPCIYNLLINLKARVFIMFKAVAY